MNLSPCPVCQATVECPPDAPIDDTLGPDHASHPRVFVDCKQCRARIEYFADSGVIIDVLLAR